MGDWDHTFLKGPTGIFRLSILSQEIPEKKLHPRKSTKLCYTCTPLKTFKASNQAPWKFHMIFSFLITPENSMLFLINPWKFHPQLHILVFFSFWNSPMTGVEVVDIPGNFCWYWICSSPDPKNSRCGHQQLYNLFCCCNYWWTDVSNMSMTLVWWSRKFIYFFFFLLLQFCYWKCEANLSRLHE